MAKILSVAVPDLPAAGMDPLHVARNGVPVGVNRVSPLNSFINSVAGRRLKVLFAKDWGRVVTTPWLFQAHTSPNCQAIIVDMVFDTGGSPAPASAQWTTEPSGGVAHAHPEVFVPSYNTGQLVPDTYTTVRQRWITLDDAATVIADTTFTAELAVSNAFVVNVCVYEEINDQIDMSEPPSAVILPTIAQGEHIYDVHLRRAKEAVETIFKRQGPVIFAYHGGASVNHGIITSTTYTNLWDTSLTAYDANGPGFWYRTKDRATRSTDAIQGVFWVYGSDDGGSDAGKVELRTADGQIAEITGIASTDAFYTTTLNTGGTVLDASQTDRYLQCLGKSGDVAGTLTIKAAGAYEYIA